MSDNPLISVITPASRGVKYLSVLIRDFKNQTFKNFEHCIVWDGLVPDDVKKFINEHINDYNIRFFSIKKDLGDMNISPGTKARNYGLSMAKGDYCCFCDDDDRVKDTYLEVHASGIHKNAISVVQMACSKARVYRNVDPKEIILIPEIGLPYFPIVCHVGTPCFMVPRKWALEDPWGHEPEHDYRFIKRIVEKHHPEVLFKPGMVIDVDGLVTRGIRDWVSIPPFYRN